MRGNAEDDGSTHRAVALCVHQHILAASAFDSLQSSHTQDAVSAGTSTGGLTGKPVVEQGLLPKQLLPYVRWHSASQRESDTPKG